MQMFYLQRHDFEHDGEAAVEVPLRGSYGSTDFRHRRSRLSQLFPDVSIAELYCNGDNEKARSGLTSRNRRLRPR